MRENKRLVSAYDKIIGRNLRSYRLLAELTQTELADALDLTFQQIQKYEKGTNRLPSGRINPACRLLNITPEQLLGVDAASQAAGATSVRENPCFQLGQTHAGIELAKAFNELQNPDARKFVVRMTRLLATIPHTMVETLIGT